MLYGLLADGQFVFEIFENELYVKLIFFVTRYLMLQKTIVFQ